MYSIGTFSYRKSFPFDRDTACIEFDDVSSDGLFAMNNPNYRTKGFNKDEMKEFLSRNLRMIRQRMTADREDILHANER